MKKNKLVVTILFLCLACTPREAKEKTPSQKEEIAKTPEMIGEKIFLNNCSSCHKQGKDDLVGPGMADITKRRKKEWIIAFIKNSQAMMAKGDTAAINVYKKYNKAMMTSFLLPEVEMEQLYKYLETL